MKTYIVDSFTDEAFKGNPAGVCLPTEKLTDEKMLLIAQELGLSETAFLYPMIEPAHCTIRYFSPVMEIPLCGHATLASAMIMFEQQNLTQIHFHNIQNLDLIVQKSGDQIAMLFPVYLTSSITVPKEMLEALGIKSILNSVFNQETNIILLEIESFGILKNLNPDIKALENSFENINGVLVTAKSGTDDFDFHSRYFWPWSGGDEDPVTGATHTFLAPYWQERLKKSKLKSFQASKRTGFMEIEILDNASMLIKGSAVKVLEGDLIC